jgi:hypothetical protein
MCVSERRFGGDIASSACSITKSSSRCPGSLFPRRSLHPTLCALLLVASRKTRAHMARLGLQRLMGDHFDKSFLKERQAALQAFLRAAVELYAPHLHHAVCHGDDGSRQLSSQAISHAGIDTGTRKRWSISTSFSLSVARLSTSRIQARRCPRRSRGSRAPRTPIPQPTSLSRLVRWLRHCEPRFALQPQRIASNQESAYLLDWLHGGGQVVDCGAVRAGDVLRRVSSNHREYVRQAFPGLRVCSLS